MLRPWQASLVKTEVGIAMACTASRFDAPPAAARRYDPGTTARQCRKSWV